MTIHVRALCCGFLVVEGVGRVASRRRALYADWPQGLEQSAYLADVHRFCGRTFDCYRGLDRNPTMCAWDQVGEGMPADVTAIITSMTSAAPGFAPRFEGPDPEASQVIRQIRSAWVADDPERDDPDLVPDRASALEVLGMTRRPEEHDVIRVARLECSCRVEGAATFLGYDAATWGQRHLSCIRDTLVLPQFAPCPSSMVGPLVEVASNLNANGLCVDVAQANRFRELYRSIIAEGKYCIDPPMEIIAIHGV